MVESDDDFNDDLGYLIFLHVSMIISYKPDVGRLKKWAKTLDVTKNNQAFLLERNTLKFLLLSEINLEAKHKLCARFARKEEGTVENLLDLSTNEDEKQKLFDLLMEIFSNGRMLRLLSEITVIPKSDKCLIYKRLVQMGPRILTEHTSREKDYFMTALSELKCSIIDAQIKAKMPKESSALPGELQICELLLNAEYLSYNDGSFLTNLAMNIQDDGVIRIIFGNIRKFTDLFYRTVKTNSRKNLAGLALFLVKLETACKRLKVAPPTCYSLSGSTIIAAIKEMQDPVFAISILEKTVLRHVSSSNLIKIHENRKFNKNQEEELVKVLLKINHVKENETLSKMINHFMRHWGLQRDEKRQEKHKRKKEQVDGHYRKK